MPFGRRHKGWGRFIALLPFLLARPQSHLVGPCGKQEEGPDRQKAGKSLSVQGPKGISEKVSMGPTFQEQVGPKA